MWTLVDSLLYSSLLDVWQTLKITRTVDLRPELWLFKSHHERSLLKLVLLNWSISHEPWCRCWATSHTSGPPESWGRLKMRFDCLCTTQTFCWKLCSCWPVEWWHWVRFTVFWRSTLIPAHGRVVLSVSRLKPWSSPVLDWSGCLLFSRTGWRLLGKVFGPNYSVRKRWILVLMIDYWIISLGLQNLQFGRPGKNRCWLRTDVVQSLFQKKKFARGEVDKMHVFIDNSRIFLVTK